MTSRTDDSDCADAAVRASGPQHCSLPGGLDLISGKRLAEVDITYETWGELDEQGTNAVLICHALTGDAHVSAGPGLSGEDRPGWWDAMVGPGQTFDTEKYFVVCANVLGGCSGTTGPGSIDPATEMPYGLTFPLVTIEDIADIIADLEQALEQV